MRESGFCRQTKHPRAKRRTAREIGDAYTTLFRSLLHQIFGILADGKQPIQKRAERLFERLIDLGERFAIALFGAGDQSGLVWQPNAPSGVRDTHVFILPGSLPRPRARLPGSPAPAPFPPLRGGGTLHP